MSIVKKTPRARITKPPKSPHKVQSKMETFVSIPDYGELDMEDIWVESLSTLNPDITNGAFSYLLRPVLSEEERNRNSMMLLSFYMACDKFPELISFAVERDYFLKIEDPSKYSPYTTAVTTVFALSFQEFFVEIQQQLIKKGTKLKGISLDEEKKGSTDKELKKAKDFLVGFMDSWMSNKNIPPVIYGIWTKTQDFLISKGVNQNRIDSAMIQLCFTLPFNCFASLFKNDPENSGIILLFNKLVNALLSPIQTESYWKQWLKNNCKELLEKMTKYMRSKKGLEIERERMVISTQFEGMSVIYMLNNDWQQIKEYLSPEGYRLIEIHMVQETNLKQKAMLIIRELNNLRVSTFNENQNYLQKMSQMKMRMKDLYEERRYLKQLLGEGGNEEEEKEENLN